jgi:glycosyltransferase involved in cell wall biosynthesis
MAADPLPVISIVTPSYNQGAFLEAAIRSVLDQPYPKCEYIVMDGGSTDNSVEIIRQYADRLAYWTSGLDGGQYAAINQGFARATGDVFAWINADDKFVPGAFQVAGEIFATHPEIEWLTTLYPLLLDERGTAVVCSQYVGYSRQEFFRGVNLPGRSWIAQDWIQQESTFWRRSLWERAGGLNPDYPLAGDFELWARFFKLADLYGVATVLGSFRMHRDQKTASLLAKYSEEAERGFLQHGGRPFGQLESFVYVKLLRRLPWRIKRLIPGMPRYKNLYYRARQGVWDVGVR